MDFKPVAAFVRKGWHWMRRRMVFPIVQHTAGCLSVWERSLSRRWGLVQPDSPGWKQQVLDDFSAWLADLSEDPPETTDLSPQTCDLYTLLMEFTALRQEIRLQNREQHRSLDQAQELRKQYAQAADLFRQRTAQIHTLEERIRLAAERKTILPFLDVREALDRGLEAAREVATRKTLFTRPPEGIDGIIQGYEMALRRFNRALSNVDVKPIEALGQPFDPAAMRAVDKKWDPDFEAGTVLEELHTGYVRKEEVLRTAEVVVNIPHQETNTPNNHLRTGG